jgi:hypothetical protein
MTIVLQSWRSTDEPAWMARCLESVRAWAESKHLSHEVCDDTLFERVPARLRKKLADRPQIAADLARLKWIEHVLATETDKAVWLDADVLLFAPGRFKPVIGPDGYLLGRELWVEDDGRGGYRVRRNVHNALIAAERSNPFIPFYRHTAERILDRLDPGPSNGMAPQVIGPKLLGALNSLAPLPLSDQVAMISPPVLRDIAAGGGPALDALKTATADEGLHPPAAANLCQSLIGPEDEPTAQKAIDALLGGGVFE